MISLNFNDKFKTDMTWATGTSVIWTQVEATVGVICACAPSLRVPLARFFPFLFGSSNTSSNSYPLGDGPTTQSQGLTSAGIPTWKETSSRSQIRSNARQDFDDDASSQEQIMGIKKTMSVDMTYMGANEARANKLAV